MPNGNARPGGAPRARFLATNRARGTASNTSITGWLNSNTTITSTLTAPTLYTSTAATIDTTWQMWTSNAITATASTTIDATWSTWDGWAIQNYRLARVQLPTLAPRPRGVAEKVAALEAAARHRLPPETPAQAAARKAATIARQLRQTAENERRAVAIVRADRLLDSILSEVQRAHVQAHGYFLVRGRSGQLYRIRRGWTANVDVLSPDGDVQHALCAHPAINCPDGDNMAAQKLMLESADEALFLRIANRHARHPERVPSEVVQQALAL